MDADEFRSIREKLGWTSQELENKLRLGSGDVRLIEDGWNDVTFEIECRMLKLSELGRIGLIEQELKTGQKIVYTLIVTQVLVILYIKYHF